MGQKCSALPGPNIGASHRNEALLCTLPHLCPLDSAECGVQAAESRFCLLLLVACIPSSGKPWSHTCPRGSELPCHKCPWIQTKANMAIKTVFNSVVPLAVPLVAAGQDKECRREDSTAHHSLPGYK